MTSIQTASDASSTAARRWSCGSELTTYLRRELAVRLGLTQKAARAVLRVSFAKVAEYQKRGLVHFHAVIRLDGPDGSTQPPPSYATVGVLTDAIRAAAPRARISVVSDAVGERELGWGQQLDVREIATFGTASELTDQAVAAYVASTPPSPRTPPGPSTTLCSAVPAAGAAPSSCPTGRRSRAPRATAPGGPDRCPASLWHNTSDR